MTRLFPPIFFLIFSAAVSLAGAANLLDGSAASERRMELLKLKFEKALKKARCPYGVLCVATADGKVYAEPVGIPAEGAEIKKRAQQKSLPLGESSFACVTFAAVKMEEAGKLDLKWSVPERFSAFSPQRGMEKHSTFSDMLYMRAGIDNAKVPPFPDGDWRRLFEVIPQTYPAEGAGTKGVFSPLCAAAVGYALGYENSRSSKNPKKSFAGFMKKYFFGEVGISQPKYRAFDSALFPAYSVALAPEECALWLKAEASAKPGTSIFARRMAPAGSRMGMGWFDIARSGVPAQVFSAFFQGCANEVAVFPSKGLAAAAFAVVDSKYLARADSRLRLERQKSARLACAETVEFLGSILYEDSHKKEGAREKLSETKITPTDNPKQDSQNEK